MRKVDVRLPGKGNSNSHGARPVHLIITMIKWIWTSRLSIKNSLLLRQRLGGGACVAGLVKASLSGECVSRTDFKRGGTRQSERDRCPAVGC